MVVFTCGHCGESLQKPKVEKHYLQTKCRNRNPNLSCMDCFKDFLGQDYEAHSKCISEAERYSGKGYVSKEKKGEKKQNTWVEMIQSVLDEQHNASSTVIKIIETVSKHTNTPRKKPKFINFVKNVCGHKTNPKDIDKAWELISVKLSALSIANGNRNKNKDPQNVTEEDETEESVNENKDADKKNGEASEEEDEDENKSDIEAQSDDDNPKKVDQKTLTKKQMKEEKKRQKYEAELQSATAPPPEEVTEESETKKGKKKKKKSESHDDDCQVDGKKSKNQKRKRLDTVNNVAAESCSIETVENVDPAKDKVEKTQKKKQRMEEEEAEQSLCLHDQNVAKIGALAVSGDQFNWHAVIVAVLQKKDNEMPFKRLQKKVLMEYSETTGQNVDERIADKFIKKLKSAPNVRVDKNRVTLID